MCGRKKGGTAKGCGPLQGDRVVFWSEKRIPRKDEFCSTERGKKGKGIKAPPFRGKNRKTVNFHLETLGGGRRKIYNLAKSTRYPFLDRGEWGRKWGKSPGPGWGRDERRINRCKGERKPLSMVNSEGRRGAMTRNLVRGEK